MTTTATQPPDLLVDQLRTAALLYASRGWHVFPLIPGTKRPACPGHPAARCDRSDPWCRHGHTGWEQRATTSDARIRRAWSSRPYGIGIACGPSRLLVIDTDQPKPDQTGDAGGRTGEDDLGRARSPAPGAAAADLHRGHPVRRDAPLLRRPGRAAARQHRRPARAAGRHPRRRRLRRRRPHRHRPALPGDRGPPSAPLPDWLAQLLTTPSRRPSSGPQRPARRPASRILASGPLVPLRHRRAGR